MKVGILTVHRAINIGAILQTYALQEVIRSMGIDVEVIDYVQEKVERVDREPYDFKKWISMITHGHFRGALCFRSLKNRVKKQRDIFDDFLRNSLLLSEKCKSNTIPSDYDAYVIGSDQLWNSSIFEGKDEVIFWGNFKRKSTAKVMAYACSTTPENLSKSSIDFIKKSLKNFNYISLREGDTTEYINSVFNLSKKAEWVLDPTLTANPEIWRKMCRGRFREEKYILYYAARTYKKDSNLLLKKTQELAESIGCSVKTLTMERVSDYLDLINNAQAVVSSSFHGIVFSLIFNKPLLAVTYGDNQDKRYVSLLKKIGGEEMLVDINDKFTIQPIDYSSINANIAEWRTQSRKYLSQICD